MINTSEVRRILLLSVTGGFISLFLLGCASHNRVSLKGDISPIMATRELPEQELLNVGIQVFDPGTLPEDKDERQGLSQDIRQAEARFIPVHLKYTLQHTGFWGSVWVIPDESRDVDLAITGRIDWSDGEKLTVTVRAVDSRNVLWLDKTYSETCTPDEQKDTEPEKKDAFQDLYNAISNDLVGFRNHLSRAEITQIRQVTMLRYGAEVSPEPFKDYFIRDEKDHFIITHLPAQNDPMIRRIKAVRSRDQMLLDTFTGMYDNYYLQLWEAYHNWRRFRADELRTMHGIEHEAFTRQALGIAAIVTAVALGAISDQDVQRSIDPVRGVLAAGGTAAIYSGYQMRKETKMNKEVIEELGESFASESRPLVVKVQGETVRLSGTAKEQYVKWQELLRKIYLSETGLDHGLPVIMGIEQEDNPQTSSEDEGQAQDTLVEESDTSTK